MGQSAPLCPPGPHGLLVQGSPQRAWRADRRVRLGHRAGRKGSRSNLETDPHTQLYLTQSVPVCVTACIRTHICSENLCSSYDVSGAVLPRGARPEDPQGFRPSEGQGQGIQSKGTRNSNLCSAENSNRVTAPGVRGHTQRVVPAEMKVTGGRLGGQGHRMFQAGSTGV